MHFKLNIHLRFYDLWPFSGERQRRSGACMSTRNYITSIHGKNKIKGSLLLINISIRTHKSWCGNQYGALKSELFIGSRVKVDGNGINVDNTIELISLLNLVAVISFSFLLARFVVFFLKKIKFYTLICSLMSITHHVINLIISFKLDSLIHLDK